MQRRPAPSCLTDSAIELTQSWVRRVAAGAKAKEFNWPSNCYPQMRELLMESTDQHCSYCDTAPVPSPEIDHFRAKVLHPTLAYEWTNLYATCSACNKLKNDDPGDDVLRPDEPGYDSKRYFVVNRFTGMLGPNQTDADDASRAAATIDCFRLNRPELCDSRRRHDQGKLDPFRLMQRDDAAD